MLHSLMTASHDAAGSFSRLWKCYALSAKCAKIDHLGCFRCHAAQAFLSWARLSMTCLGNREQQTRTGQSFMENGDEGLKNRLRISPRRYPGDLCCDGAGQEMGNREDRHG